MSVRSVDLPLSEPGYGVAVGRLDLSGKRVITYGTFDLFHSGHRRLLERAKALGDFLIVGVTSQSYDAVRGKLNVHQSLAERMENVRSSGLADLILVEEYEGQKVNDIQQHGVSVFAIGSDWLGRFDYLQQYCEVVYLERTPGVSSTDLRAQAGSILKIGVVGTGRIAHRFIPESKFVSGVDVQGVAARTKQAGQDFRERHGLAFSTTDFDELLERVDAVYVATPHGTHFEYARRALEADRHVLCEKPMTLTSAECVHLVELAESRELVLLEAIKTAYSPGFLRLVALVKTGIVGQVRTVEARFTKLADPRSREMQETPGSGSLTELASYPLHAIAKLLGTAPIGVEINSIFDGDTRVDQLSTLTIRYRDALAHAVVALGAKAEGDLVIGGTTGYVYVPAPWWKPERFEIRDSEGNPKHFVTEQFAGDGLRYEIAELLELVRTGKRVSYKVTPDESVFLQSVIERSPTLQAHR